MFWIIPAVIIFLSLSTVVGIIVRILPRLRVINVDSIPKEKTRRIKEQIILRKFERASSAKIQFLKSIFVFLGEVFSKSGRRAVQKLYSIEQSYQKLKRSASEGQFAYDTETINNLVHEAESQIDKSEFIPAEKIFIDIISHNPKNIDAYEGLGNLYLKSDQPEQARETFSFALRLSPNDASVHVSFAELEMKLDNPKAAVVHLKKAVQKRSKNPKYLDLYIEASLKAGSLKDAREGIRLLKAVNPENQKISDFEDRYQKQKEVIINKASTEDIDTSQNS